MGAFDDLVPSDGGSKNPFEDLVPVSPEKALPYAVSIPQQAMGQAQRLMQAGALVQTAPYAPEPDYSRIAAMAGGGTIAGPAPPVPLDQLIGGLAQQVPPGQNLLTQTASSLAKTGLGFAAGAVAPENLTAMVAAPVVPPLAAAYFAAQMGKGALEQGKQAVQLYQQPGPVDAAWRQKMLDALVGTGAMAVGAGETGLAAARGVIPRPQPAQPAPAPVLDPDAIMAALQKRQIVREDVRQKPQPGIQQPVQMAPEVAQAGMQAQREQQVQPGVQEPSASETGTTTAPAAPVVQPTVPTLRPAIVKLGGEIIPGEVGDIHDDIIDKYKLTAKDIDSRVFLDEQGNVLSREQAALVHPEIPTVMQPGKRHANELPVTIQPTEQPSDTQSQRGIQGGIPQGQVPQPSLPEPVSGEQATPTGGVLQAPEEVTPTTPLRQEVEKQTDFLHDLNGLAFLIKGNKDAKRITDTQAVNFKNRANQVNDQLQAGKIDQAEAQKRLGTIREDIANQVSLGEELGPQEGVSSPEREADIAKFKSLQSQAREYYQRTKQFPTEIQQQMEDIKNKYKGFVPGTEPQEAPKPSSRAVHKVDTTSLSPYAQSAVSELGITEKTTAHEAIESIANNPSKFGSRNSELARFLADNFEHVLRSTGIDLGTGRSKSGLPNYDPIDNTVYLGANSASIDAPLSHAMLEEAAHAATYWQIEHPVTDLQKRASEQIKSIMEQSKKLLPDSALDKIGEQPYGLPYRHSSLSEFVAGMFSDSELRRHLESFTVDGKNAWTRLVDWVKDVLGIQKGTALDKAMDELVKVGQESRSIDPNRRLYDLDPVNAPQPAKTASVIDRTLDEKLKGNYNKWRGYTVPKHVAANEEAANRLVRYASARIAAPEVAKWMATDVLGQHWKDKSFSTKLGSVLVEDRLRAVKSAFQKLADSETDATKKAELQAKADSVTTSIGMQGSSLKTEADFNNALQDPDIQASLSEHRTYLGPMTEHMHEYLGGQLAEKGERTGAFVNLIALLTDPENPGSVESAKSMIYGATRGNLANPRLRGSAFSKEAKGTGVGYEFNYRTIAERMVRANYEQYALKRYYEKLVEQGLAVEEKPGVVPPTTLKGHALEKLEIKPGRAFIAGKNLWIRKDLAGEMRRAMDVDKVDNVGLKLFTDLSTDLQVIGPTDAAWHTINMLAIIAGSQGARSAWYDAVRKTTPVGVVDGIVRMTVNTAKALMDTPDVQKIIADYSAQGAGRGKAIHRGGVISKVVTAVTDIPIETTQKYDPIHRLVNEPVSRLIKAIDKGGRITASDMFDNLVARGMVKDTELNRREFINRMGQYNSRLMPQWQQIFRDNSLSAFVVAGKNMNRQAIRRIIGSPGFAAANPEAAIKARLLEYASLASMVFVLPSVLNYAINGTIFPRAGIPIGGIDLGTNDEKGKPKYFDPLQLLLIRRGLRITGVQALRQGMHENVGISKTGRQVVNDIFQGYIHPWAGPAIRTAKIALTGRDVGGFLLSRNPDSLTENLIAAAKNLNPSMASLFRDSESGQASPKSVVSSLGGAVGLKSGRRPTHIEELDKEAKKLGVDSYQKLNLQQKRLAERNTEKASKAPRDLLSERAGAYRQLGESFARQDELVGSLPKEQIDWAKKHSLDLYRGYQTELTVGGTRLPETQADKDFMAKQVAVEYQKVISGLMKRATPPNQKQLDHFLTQARSRARVALRRRMAGTSGQTVPDVVPVQ